MSRRTLILALGVALVSMPASAKWGAQFDSSVASGIKTCNVFSTEGIAVSLKDDPEEGQQQIVVALGLEFRTKAYLAWGEERFATEPARPGGAAAFHPSDWPRLIYLLGSGNNPAIDLRSERFGRRRGGLDVGGFRQEYEDCISRLGWQETENYTMVDRSVETESEEQTGAVPGDEGRAGEEPDDDSDDASDGDGKEDSADDGSAQDESSAGVGRDG